VRCQEIGVTGKASAVDNSLGVTGVRMVFKTTEPMRVKKKKRSKDS
jgi:hypothetical protein